MLNNIGFKTIPTPQFPSPYTMCVRNRFQARQGNITTYKYVTSFFIFSCEADRPGPQPPPHGSVLMEAARIRVQRKVRPLIAAAATRRPHARQRRSHARQWRPHGTLQISNFCTKASAVMSPQLPPTGCFHRWRVHSPRRPAKPVMEGSNYSIQLNTSPT